MKVLKDAFLDEVKKIANLSEKVNKENNQKILEMIKEHSEEISVLYNSKNDHWPTETADLVVLCFELLITENKNIDNIFESCLPRFHKKLNELKKQI
jgi:hypothetical protein